MATAKVVHTERLDASKISQGRHEMNVSRSIVRSWLWFLGAFLLGLVSNYIGQQFDGSSDSWFSGAVYHIVLLLAACIAVSIGISHIKATIGPRYGLLTLLVIGLTFLAFWSFREVAVILTFGAWAMFRDTLIRKLRVDKGRGN